MATKITIDNLSDKTISLIPFSCESCKNPREFVVRKNLAKNIPASDCIEVEPSAYDLGDTAIGFQIHMLFRAGEFPDKVKPEGGENVFLYTGLAARTGWKLSLEENGHVKGGPDNAAGPTSSGTNAAGPQIESQLQELKEEVEKLKNQFKDLLDRIKALETALRQS